MRNTAPEISPLHVAVGVLQRADGRFLITRRKADTHQGGLWEFPGGKVEAGESVQQALRRELREELGVDIEAFRPLIRLSHRYHDREVLLDTWWVNAWRGEARSMEQQPLEWVTLEELRHRPMPAADWPIITAIALPSVYLITPPRVEDSRTFLGQLQAALETGISLVQFRVSGMADAALKALAVEARCLCEQAGARLLMNAPLSLVRDVGAHGMHLNSRALATLESREGIEDLLLGASCHDARELAMARDKGVDFALLSPVLPTRSHPDVRPLGWGRFSELVDTLSLPVYALGGMNMSLLPRSWQAGAQGIAGIRGLWPGSTAD